MFQKIVKTTANCLSEIYQFSLINTIDKIKYLLFEEDRNTSEIKGI